LLASFAALSGSPAVAQTNGDALMREANHLFRSKVYRAALMRYHEAEKAGLSRSGMGSRPDVWLADEYGYSSAFPTKCAFTGLL